MSNSDHHSNTPSATQTSHDSISTGNQASYHVIASENSWIEGEAIRQLQSTAQLQGMQRVVGMPDLHPGKGTPIGATFISKDCFYPHLVGNDIGCGMALWQTSLKTRKVKRDKLVKKLSQLPDESPIEDSEWQDYIEQGLQHHQMNATAYDDSLGTIGGGNHFAELQMIDHIEDQELCDQLELSKNYVYLMVHSGSRGYGQDILQDHLSQFGAQALQYPSAEASQYLAKHQHATQWAYLNRQCIAHRFSEALHCDLSPIVDLFHNTVSAMQMDQDTYWIHRKGAAPSDQGPVIIPGSRGTWTYLVQPLCATWEHAYSLAHGAGRKWKRSEAKGKLKARYRVQDLKITTLGSAVICENRDLLYQEAPEAYKKIEQVIDDLQQAGLVKVIARFKPLVTYKTSRS